MSTGSINPVSTNHPRPHLDSALPGAGSKARDKGNASAIEASSLQPDTSRVSPFGHLVSTLQQLQHSDPANFQQLTQQIAANLQTAAGTALGGGDTDAADLLSQLATGFTNASSSGQLPNIHDLARALAGAQRNSKASGISSGAVDSMNIIQEGL